MTFQAPQTVAALRRVAPGTRVRITMNQMGVCDVHATVEKITDKEVRLTRADGRQSYFPLPKAAHFLPNKYGFAVMGDNGPRMIVNWPDAAD